MIVYVLVMVLSLATGRPTHASLEGPMAKTWCEQLIQRDAYSAEDATTRKAPLCVSWPDAQRMLSRHFCRPTPGPSPGSQSSQFECVAPATVSGRGPALPAVAEPDMAPVPAPRMASIPVPAWAPTARTQHRAQPRRKRLPTSVSPAGPLSSTRVAPLPSTEPAPGSAQPEVPAAPVEPVPLEQPTRPVHKEFHLSPAAAALVAQAHSQANRGGYGLAAATIERALRIEPGNPLLWVELGRVRLGEGNSAQADVIAHKALTLATGDSQAQATAWRLIAESLRAQGRDQAAAEAEHAAVTSAAQ